MNRREFVTSSVCACLATTVARVGAAFGAEGGPITVGGKQYASRKAFVETGRRCGTPLPSLYDIRRTQRVRSALRSNHVEFNTNTIIPVHFHVIHDGVTGNLPDRQLKAQVDFLNKVYAPVLLQFQIADVGRHQNEEWYHVAGFEADWRDAVTLMEMMPKPDPRQAEILPVVRYAASRKAAKNADYWDHATLLELAVLARDVDDADERLGDALMVARASWELETTAPNLRLIREMRESRGEDAAWIKPLEETLKERGARLEAAKGT
jgi:MAP3K TRAFs-binding domain